MLSPRKSYLIAILSVCLSLGFLVKSHAQGGPPKQTVSKKKARGVCHGP